MMRSWLAEAKSVHDIGGFFLRERAGEAPNDELERKRREKFRSRVWKPPPVAAGSEPYFATRMHDSKVLAVIRDGDVLRLRLDSINAGGFSYYLAEVLGVTESEIEWPVELVFRGVHYVRAASGTIDGKLRFMSPRDLVGCDFLYDWFFEEQERLQFIAELWCFAREPSDSYLMVDCLEASAVDFCPQIFAREYGAPAATLYLDAVAGLDEKPIEFNVFETPGETPDFIRRRMKARRIPRSSLRRS